MPDLKPITALGLSQVKSLKLGSLSLTENSGLALASLALRRDIDAPRPFGLLLPEPGSWVERGGVGAFWTGPNQWIIEAEWEAERDFCAEVVAACPGQSVTEQTDGFVAFEFHSESGADLILALMAKLVNIDPRLFAPGSATRAGLGHMNVFVIRRAEDRLAVLGMRSAAGTLWHELECAVKRLAEVQA